MARQLISSGSSFEREIGYSRAVVDGDWVFVSGTTGFDYAAMTIADDVVAQCEQCLKNIESALQQAGASFADVVRVDLPAAARRGLPGVLAGAAALLRRGAAGRDDDLGRAGRSAHEDRDRGHGAQARRGHLSRVAAAHPRKTAFRRIGAGAPLTPPLPAPYRSSVAHSAATLQTEGDVRLSSRRRLLPGWRPLALVVGVAAIAAWALMAWAHNTYIELLGETLFVGIMLMFAFRGAGAWRQDFMPRWLAQVIAVAIAAALAPLIVQLLSAGGDFFAFISSRSHVKGYILVTVAAAIIGTVLALGALYREHDAQARAQALQLALLRETLERQDHRRRNCT
jgi:hypothetical protein